MISFREMIESDLEFFTEVRNSCAEKYLHDSRLFALDEVKKWFPNTPNVYYIIEYNNERVGYFRTSNYSAINKNICIGADIHEKYRNLGIAYNAYVMFINYLFGVLVLHKISLEVLSNNDRAIHLYKKIGFIEEGRRRDDIKKGDAYVDSIVMSILENEWKERHT